MQGQETGLYDSQTENIIEIKMELEDECHNCQRTQGVRYAVNYTSFIVMVWIHSFFFFLSLACRVHNAVACNIIFLIVQSLQFLWVSASLFNNFFEFYASKLPFYQCASLANIMQSLIKCFEKACKWGQPILHFEFCLYFPMHYFAAFLRPEAT